MLLFLKSRTCINCLAMKKLTILLLILFFSLSIFASNDGLFDIDEEFIEEQFESLNRFENLFLEEDVTLHELWVSGNQMIIDLGLIATFPDMFNDDESRVLGIPSILYGLFLGPVGVAIVGISSKSWKETKKALLGCGISGMVAGVTYLIANSAAEPSSRSCGNPPGEACGSALGQGCGSAEVSSCSFSSTSFSK